MLLTKLCILSVVFLLSQTSSAQLTTVSPAGAEDSDSDLDVFPLGLPFPGDRPPPSDSFRFQELHPTAFESLGPGPFLITSMAWRPDISVNGPVSKEWEILALNLTTTPVEPGEMSLTFADNYGPDGATTVLSGTVRFETDGVPSAGGLPHDFDYVFEFDTPYLYDPAKGNLLVEILGDPPDDDPWIWTDGASEGQFTSALSTDAEVAINTLQAITVTQFTFTAIPEPSTWLLGLLLCAAVAAYRLGLRIVRRPNFALLTAAMICVVSVATAGATTVVAPNGFEDVEGSDVGNPARPYPQNAPPNRETPEGFAVQELYFADELAPAGDGPLVISELAWRPDRSVYAPVSAEYDYRIWLGTTPLGSLGPVRANNYPSVPPSLVFDGVLSLATDGVPRPGGLPHEFDYVIQFQTPYRYDPSQGDLIVEMESSLDHLAAPIWRDFQEGLATKRFAFFANHIDPEFAVAVSSQVSVAQFTIAAEPTSQLGDYNGNQMVEQADLDLVLLHWGEVLSDPAAVGWNNDLPNGVIDQQELDKVLLNWGQTADGLGSAGVPEPSSGLLLFGGSVTWLVAAARTSILKRKAAPTDW